MSVLDQVFNSFCRVVEAVVPDRVLWSALRHAPLCQFEASSEAHIDAVVSALDAREQWLPPMMPFEMIVLVTPLQVTMFYDVTDFEPGTQFADGTAYNDMDGGMPCTLRDMRVAVFSLPEGPDGGWLLIDAPMLIHEPNKPKTVRLAVQPESTRLWSGPTIGQPPLTINTLAMLRARDAKGGELFHDALLKSAQTGLSLLTYIDLPRHHLIVESPVKRQHADGPKQPRAHDRDRLLLIEPEAVYKIYKRDADVEATGRVVVPHARRGHTRILTNARYTKKQWTVVRVRPTWVGDPEWRVGPRRYKVIVRDNDAQAGTGAG